MKRFKVDSSSIASVGYDATSKTLEIKFKDGLYQYFDVPESVYKEFISAGSLGQYFNTNIKNEYKFTRIS